MASATTPDVKSVPASRRPTEYLLRAEAGQLSQVMVYRLTLTDVRWMALTMVEICSLVP
ncbi:Uncharacterized protein ABJ99_2453 [Pseudomonas syringae pv. cilantro]|nr:Uncharacterized protein ABJ99_2453 [Pseudomonas syringae pv. cilantro]